MPTSRNRRASQSSEAPAKRSAKRARSRGRQPQTNRPTGRLTRRRPDSSETRMQADEVACSEARGRKRITDQQAHVTLPDNESSTGSPQSPTLPSSTPANIAPDGSAVVIRKSHRSAWLWSAGIVMMSVIAAVEVSGTRQSLFNINPGSQGSELLPSRQNNDDLQRHSAALNGKVPPVASLADDRGGSLPRTSGDIDMAQPLPRRDEKDRHRTESSTFVAEPVDATGELPKNGYRLPSLSEVWLVWCAAWLTAAATGLGALPFACGSKLPDALVAISNAAAAGMMLAASTSLVLEALAHAVAMHSSHQEGMGDGDDSGILPGMADDLLDGAAAGLGDWWAVAQVLLGAACGVGFVLGTHRWLSGHDEVTLADVGGLDAKRMLLLVAVMTAHSCTEGISIGVSYAGSSGEALGHFMSSILALHNVPEGLATALVLVPRGVAPLEAAVYAVGTSVPQPVFAVLGMLFVSVFRGLLPAGFGFAAGAMVWVALFDLAMEAAEAMGWVKTVAVTALAGAGMMATQMLMRGGG